MSENEIAVIKSPVVPLNIPDKGMIIYGNQVTYSVRLPNGIIVTNPEEFPNDNEDEQIIIDESTEEGIE